MQVDLYNGRKTLVVCCYVADCRYLENRKTAEIYFVITRTRGWWRGTVVERLSLAGELSLSCARPAADG